MDLEQYRFSDDEDSSLGLMFDVRGSKGISLMREFLCFTLEDEYRNIKVKGETRIPEGRYEIKLRTEGGMTVKYATRFPDIHKGMLWLQDVPNFEWVYIHTGNKDEHTDGCILVGDSCQTNVGADEGFVGHSVAAYVRLYLRIMEALEEGEPVFITIHDMERK